MKIKSLLPSLILGVFLMGAVTASAQRGTPSIAPDKQFGIGVYGGGTASGGGLSGQYAISPSVQIGLGLGLAGQSSNGASTTDYSADIFGRFLFEGTVNPFAQVGFRRLSTDITPAGSTVATTVSSNQLYLGFGLNYYFNHNVGVYSMFELLTLDLSADPSVTNYGFRSARVGVEWFFNP